MASEQLYNANVLPYKLLDLMERTGYPIVQQNAQRKFGPPPDWTGPPPQNDCEVFVGKLPRELFEDELVPIFFKVGKIYEMRLIMNYSGANRGYAFVTYTTKTEALKAVKELNGYEVRPGRNIGVVRSADNRRLFVGCIPRSKTREEIYEELSKLVSGIVDVFLTKNYFDRRLGMRASLNPGFAFVEFESHHAAVLARRTLVTVCMKLWAQQVTVDWAGPEPDVEQMKKVKVVYAQNFKIGTKPYVIQSIFEKSINFKIERIRKIKDHAFIHFYTREHAELAKTKLQNTVIDGRLIEIRWAKQAERELYRIQKLKGINNKFDTLDLSPTLLLYKQHLEEKEYAKFSKEDEEFGSACGSPTDNKSFAYSPPKDSFCTWAPDQLDSICRRYMWAPPMYDYEKYDDGSGAEVWVGRVQLPQVGLPLLSSPRRVCVLATRPCLSMQQAHVEAAKNALHCIEVLCQELIQHWPPCTSRWFNLCEIY